MHLRFLARKSLSWSYGLVRIQDFSTVFSSGKPLSNKGGVSPFAFKMTRSDVPSPGFTVLDAKKKPAVYLQPSIEAFQSRWNSMTGNVLHGLDWSNVFVAGGTALGSLLTPEIPSDHDDGSHVPKEAEWLTSDIDMYIYGLGPKLANLKLKHIADTYQKNLPAGAPFLIVRNSQTVTLYSQFPTKRVQIVMKLMSSPRDVLLNFDLDICAVGFDGAQVWMLPRCARAIESQSIINTKNR